jgi:predicted RecA/RadA family phage recombinase
MQMKMLYGQGGEVHLTAAGTAGTVVYSAGDVLSPTIVGGNVCGVVAGASPIRGGERFSAYTRGVGELASASGTTFSKGAEVEFNDTTDLGVASGDFRVGPALVAKTSGQLNVLVHLNEFGDQGGT